MINSEDTQPSKEKLDYLSKYKEFYYWINERHAIYQKRKDFLPPPWTDDPILQEYKFTNPFRENDRDTIWMRQNWTKPHDNRPHGEIIFNCCLFRMVGTPAFAEQHGWVHENPVVWDSEKTKHLIETRLAKGEKTYTGAYIIPNRGLKLKKSEVVVDLFLKPVWEKRNEIANVAKCSQSLEETHAYLGKFNGWGGGGFMAYEVVTDLSQTSVLKNSQDRFSWANAGPGARRGLNRIYGRPLKKKLPMKQLNKEMENLLFWAEALAGKHIPKSEIDMRVIEHSLCEWDKYQRVLLNEGRPRSKYNPDLISNHKFVKGPID